jgi:heterodisulfide reductase subunit D
MSEERCCGSFAMRIGERDLARSLAEHNLAQITKKKPKTVVFTCPGCLRAFRRDYPEMGLELGFEPLHISEYLQRAIDDGTATIQGDMDAVITYHDPCHMGRHLGIYDPPREVLKKIPGLELQEMERNREAALCCGAGGGVKSAYPEWAQQTAEKRLLEASMTDARFLVTSCPFCLHNLQESLAATAWVSDVDKYVRVMDFAVFLSPFIRRA